MVWPTFQPQPVNVMVATDIYFLELKPNKTHFEIIESKFGQPSNGRVFREDNLGLKDKDHNRREIGDFGLGKHSYNSSSPDLASIYLHPISEYNTILMEYFLQSNEYGETHLSTICFYQFQQRFFQRNDIMKPAKQMQNIVNKNEDYVNE